MAEAPDLILCWPGKTTAEYARVGIADYLDRVRRFRDCKRLVVPEARGRMRQAEKLEREGETIVERLDAFQPNYVTLVDPRGKMMKSEEFASFLRRQCYDDARSLTFVVGGPDGVSAALRQHADRLLGLSRMTLPHDLARLVLVEQIYRGFTLIHGMPYSR